MNSNYSASSMLKERSTTFYSSATHQTRDQSINLALALAVNMVGKYER